MMWTCCLGVVATAVAQVEAGAALVQLHVPFQPGLDEVLLRSPAGPTRRMRFDERTSLFQIEVAPETLGTTAAAPLEVLKLYVDGRLQVCQTWLLGAAAETPRYVLWYDDEEGLLRLELGTDAPSAGELLLLDAAGLAVPLEAAEPGWVVAIDDLPPQVSLLERRDDVLIPLGRFLVEDGLLQWQGEPIPAS